jgi:transposase
MSSQSDMKQKKASSLLEEGALNAYPEKVKAPGFQEGDFLDPRDIVQVKYEMLRRVRVENATVTEAAKEYGFSRNAFYHSNARFDEAGLNGLIPEKRGPRGPHKVNAEVLNFLRNNIEEGKPVRARRLAMLVRQEFGLDIHPRTIERVLSGKKTPQ